MDKSKVFGLLNSYFPLGKEEQKFKNIITEFIDKNPDFYSKANKAGHLTSSAWIISHDKSKVLLTHHKKLDKWLQTGGHIDNDPDLFTAALREAREETGLRSIIGAYDQVFDIDVHPIPANKKENEHIHYDFRFLFIADPGEMLKISSESKDLKWFSVSQFKEIIDEPSLLRMLKKSLEIKGSSGA
jgi:8-oxo-dGTP pyrophosphatase MutT (NUDIX family)